ncbi:MAG: sodium:calcium antiporter [Thermomicrobiales bacterium]
MVAAALGLIVAGAESLLSGVTSLSRQTRLSAFALTVLLSGMELENIAAGVAANLAGFPGAALGTSLGGVVFLALGVTGFGALLAPFRTEISLGVLMWVAAAPLPLLALAVDREISRLDGVLLVVAFLPFIVGLARTGVEIDEDDDDDDDGLLSRLNPVLRVALGLVLMALGGNLLSDGLRSLVARFPAGPTLLGNTAIAAVVESEEIVRVAVPSRRGRADVAVGNIAGTIVHFLTLNAGIIAIARPLALDRATLTYYLPAAVIAPTLCFILLRARHGAGRGMAALLLALYAVYILLSFRVAGGS